MGGGGAGERTSVGFGCAKSDKPVSPAQVPEKQVEHSLRFRVDSRGINLGVISVDMIFKSHKMG
jgi:hypothetical protein